MHGTVNHVIRIQWNHGNNSDHVKVRISQRKMLWFWSTWPENLFGLRGVDCIQTAASESGNGAEEAAASRVQNRGKHSNLPPDFDLWNQKLPVLLPSETTSVTSTDHIHGHWLLLTIEMTPPVEGLVSGSELVRPVGHLNCWFRVILTVGSFKWLILGHLNDWVTWRAGSF